MKERYEIAVVGGGLAGLSAALAASRSGRRTALIAPKETSKDARTTAILQENIEFLGELGAWDRVEEHAAPLRTMRIIDDTGRLIRAPQVDFKSREIGLEAFGYNIENRLLASEIAAIIETDPTIEWIDGLVMDVDFMEGSFASIKLSDRNPVEAEIIFAADGRNSTVRMAAGIDVRQWSYPQIALVGNFSHTMPHGDASTEFHTPTGPFTVVPLGRNRCSLVCVESPAGAERLLGKQADELHRSLERRMYSILGKIELEAALKSFPLSGMVANRFGKGNLCLIGEAGHVFPPIGAQGLNLGLRDVATVFQLLMEDDFSDSRSFGERYHQMRFSDVNVRTTSVDLLNRSLLTDFIPVQAVRSLGLQAVAGFAPGRKLLMREGIAPGNALPSVASRFSSRFS